MGDPVNSISTWLRGLMASLGLAPGFIDFVIVLLVVSFLLSPEHLAVG